MASAAPHHTWYGAQPQPQPPGDFPLRQPYYEAAPAGRPPPRRRRRGCGFAHSVVRQLSFAIPVILVIITAYVYGRSETLGGVPAGDPAWVPLYLTIPLVRTPPSTLPFRPPPPRAGGFPRFT